MPHEDPVNWQPIREMPLIARMIDGALDDTREHLETLAEARMRPHVLDDATIDRVEQVHAEQLEFVDIYAQQISRWRTEKPSAGQMRELDRMEAQNGHLRAQGLRMRSSELNKIMQRQPESNYLRSACARFLNHEKRARPD